MSPTKKKKKQSKLSNKIPRGSQEIIGVVKQYSYVKRMIKVPTNKLKIKYFWQKDIWYKIYISYVFFACMRAWTRSIIKMTIGIVEQKRIIMNANL